MFEHYKGNCYMNQIAGNDPLPPLCSRAEYQPTVLKCIALVAEEVQETCRAFESNDYNELRDGIADIIVTLDGLVYQCLSGGDENYIPYDLDWLKRGELLLALSEQQRVQQLLSACQRNVESMQLTLAEVSYFSAVQERLRQFSSNIYGLIREVADLCQIPYEEDQKVVLASNLSKFDRTVEDAIRGTVAYAAKGVKTTINQQTLEDGDYYVIKVMEDCTDRAGKFYPKGKFLKSLSFQAPQFEPIATLLALGDGCITAAETHPLQTVQFGNFTYRSTFATWDDYLALAQAILSHKVESSD